LIGFLRVAGIIGIAFVKQLEVYRDPPKLQKPLNSGKHCHILTG
jgi:hypothetical protein